ncbi:MAG: alanine racemase [Erysipelotrichaceae bacterium]|nr:alanine racemase [Erysipelotrichaceae bacterium]
MFYRPAWEEINLDNLDFNLQYLKEKLGQQKMLIAVIKANGYGAGDRQVAEAAISGGAGYLAVSSLDEAIALRLQGISTPILVLNYVSPQHLLAALQHDVTITVTSLEHAQAITMTKLTNLKIHLKVDTGMNRIGFKHDDELKTALTLLRSSQQVEGIFTHYLDSGIDQNPITLKQYQSFKETLAYLNYPFKYIHTANSDAIINFHDEISNAARAGIAMFGISSYSTDLKPVCALYTKITHIKQVSKGETISYSGTYTTENNEWIATVPLGYADGLLRHNQNRRIYVNGEYGTIVGRICMDQCMIKLTKFYPVDTVVEIFGPHLGLTEAAEYLDTIPYEILTSISDRVARVYRRATGVELVSNLRLDHYMK